MKIHSTLSALLAAPSLLAQDFLFTTSQTESTLSGSAGTVLQSVRPNEIVHLPFCSPSAEKWAPRACFQTMAGDDDNDDQYWEPSLLGNIDALLTMSSTAAGGVPNQRTIFYSPSQPLGTTISGAPGLRPGDVGRIRKIGVFDGQVEYFVRAEQLQMAIGLPPAPVVIDVDAIAAGPNFGVLFSLDADVVGNLCTTGLTLIRDGDVVLIPPAAMGWSPQMTVAMVVPGGAVVAITEAQMDAMVVNAGVTDRDGICVAAIQDTEALELDLNGAFLWPVPTCTGPVPVPHLLFSGETLTGGAILDTTAGGSIHVQPCGIALGTACGFGPTMGIQIGLRPPSAVQGIASHVTALTTTRASRFVAESPTPQIPVGTPAVVDFGSPGALTWVFLTFAPGGPGVVPSSTPFPFATPPFFPDYFPVPAFLAVIGTAGGFGTYVSPPVPWPADLLLQGVTITPWGSIEVSTPTIVEVF